MIYPSTAGNDTIYAIRNVTVNVIDGGTGVDTLWIDQMRQTNYIISGPDANGVTTLSGASGSTFSLTNVEYVYFQGSRTTYTVPSDLTAPTVSAFSPADAAIGVALASDIVVTFSEAVQRGTGSIVLTNAAGTVIETFDAATSNLLTISGTTLTINPTSDFAYNTNYFVTFASGAIKDLFGNAYAGISTYDFTTLADTTAPAVAALSPAAGATGVDTASNITVTFNEAIQRGTGSIALTDAAGTIIETFDAATSSLSISGTTLTINPTNNLAGGTNYFVTLAPGAINDLAGNAYPGFTSYSFTTVVPPDTTAPTVSAFSPANAATGADVAGNISVTFSEAIQRGTGSIVLTNAAGAAIETFDAATSSLLTISGTALTINPASDLANGANYFVTFAPGTIKDLAGNAYAGTTTYNFTTVADTTAPTVSSFSPADAATNVGIADNIVATFNEAVQRGTGSIVLKNAAGATIESFDAAASSLLTISGTTLTINPTSDLANGANYFVTFAPGTIKDLAGNAYAGTTTYDFTTIAATTSGNDTITAGAGNDTLSGGGGNDIIDGGAGIDIATYSVAWAPAAITKTSTGYTVSAGTDGTDTLTNIERLYFADKKLALDLDGNAGATAKILGAVFGAAAVSNQTYVGIGLSILDGGMSSTDLMAAALSVAGATTSDAVVSLLWSNLVGAAPTAAEAAPYIALLDSGAYSAGAFGMLAADTSVNTAHINLVGLTQTGIEYI